MARHEEQAIRSAIDLMGRLRSEGAKTTRAHLKDLLKSVESRKPAVFHDEIEWSKRLLRITRGCRPDMHEPDDQGLYADVAATSVMHGKRMKNGLDNAMGDESGQGEYVVNLIREAQRAEGRPDWEEGFNLATLIALARYGAQSILRANGYVIVPDMAWRIEEGSMNEGRAQYHWSRVHDLIEGEHWIQA